MGGETSSLTPAAVASGEKAELGAESLDEAVVTQFVSEPLLVEVQPPGSAGAATLSKFSP